MRKLWPYLLLVVLLCSFVLATGFSTNPTDYYFNGTYFLTDGIDNDVAIDSNTPVNTDLTTAFGWTKTLGTSQAYNSTRAFTGSLSIASDGGEGSKVFLNNASFTGTFAVRIFHPTTTTDHVFQYNDGNQQRLTAVATSANWRYQEDGGAIADCDANTITKSSTANKWVEVMYAYNGTSNTVNSYIDGILCHTFTSESGVNTITILEGNVATWFDEFWVSNGDRPKSNAIFEIPTPINGATNNTAVNINVSCPSGNVNLWFDTDTDPKTLRINNQASPANWSTFSTVTVEQTYFYKAFCSGDPANSTIRNWIYDITKPTITLNPRNHFTVFNTTSLRADLYGDLLQFNITYTDNLDLFAHLINITNSTNGVVFNTSNQSITGTSFNLTKLINISKWAEGQYTVNVTVSDSHTALEIGNYEYSTKNKEITFDTKEGNNIIIQSDLDSTPSATKRNDRYNFGFDFGDSKSISKEFTLKSDNKITYLPNSIYAAHFVISNGVSGNWIDFEGYDIPNVYKISDYEYRIVFDNLIDKPVFNSIGGLNVQSSGFSFYRGIPTLSQSTNFSQLNSTLTITLTKDSTIGDIDATLFYNGSTFSSPTKTTNVNNIIFTQEVTIPTLTDNQTIPYFWNGTVNYTNGDLSRFNQSAIQDAVFWDLDNCSIYSVRAIDFFLKNETGNNEPVPSRVTGTFNFTAGGGVFKQYSLDMKKRINFSICITPDVELTGDWDIKFSANNYPQRTSIQTGTIFSSSTQNIDLFLLNVLDGIYVRFKTIDQLDNTIIGVKIDSRLSGSSSIIETQFTDDSGLATFWVNPNSDYQFTFSKTGFTNVVVNLRPTTSEIISVIMGSAVSDQPPPESSGVLYGFRPLNILLNNQTSYDFQFNITSDIWDITNCIFRLKNNSGTILASTTGTFNTTACGATITQNTLNLSIINAEAIVTQNLTTNVTYQQAYSVLYNYQGEFSLKTFIDDLTNFGASGFNDRTRLLIVLISIIAISAITFQSTGLTNAEGQMILVWALITFFSYIGWLTITNPNLPQIGIGAFSLSKWFIWILMTLFIGGYIIRRHIQ